MFKRVFDLALALLGILLTFPLMIVIALLIRVQMGSPILFKQKRPGLYGKPFYIYKFRTMTDDRDESGELLPEEKRLTKVGAKLREHSLDELPQLFNVIKGQISLVGPRPLTMEYLERYSPEQARRHNVIPGITGWAQVNGRNTISWEERFKLDVWYVDNQSFWLDLKILYLTLFKVINRDGINQEGHICMPEFMGSKKDISQQL